MRKFTRAAEALHDLDLVAFDEECPGLAHAKLDVMHADLHAAAETDFLEFATLGILAVLLLGLRLFVLELAEVHDLADRRAHIGGDLDEVEAGLLGHALGLVGLDDTDHRAVLVDQADRADADAVIDARARGGEVALEGRTARRELADGRLLGVSSNGNGHGALTATVNLMSGFHCVGGGCPCSLATASWEDASGGSHHSAMVRCMGNRRHEASRGH